MENSQTESTRRPKRRSGGQPGNWNAVGISLDSESDPNSDNSWSGHTDIQNGATTSRYSDFPAEGFHFLQLLEFGGNAVNATFYGYQTSGALTVAKSVAAGFVMG